MTLKVRLLENFETAVINGDLEKVKDVFAKGFVSPYVLTRGLIIAMKNEKREIIDFLLENKKELPLHLLQKVMKIAVEFDYRNVFDTCYTGKESKTFLNSCVDIAAEFGRLDFCELFLREKVFVATKLGELLKIATAGNYKSLVKLFLAAGKITISDITGAYKIAQEQGFVEIAKLLKETGKVKDKKTDDIIFERKKSKPKMFIDAIVMGDIDTAKKQEGIEITKDVIKTALNKAIVANSLISVKFLMPYIDSYKYATRQAFIYDRCEILELIYNADKILCDTKESLFQGAIKNEKLQVLKLMVEKFNLSDSMINRGLKIAQESQKFKSAEYLREMKFVRDEFNRKTAEILAKIKSRSKEYEIA